MSQCLSLAGWPTNGGFVVALVDPQMSLATPAWTNGLIQLSLTGEPGVSYVIESSPDLVKWTPTVTNSDTNLTRMVSFPAPDGTGYYRVRRDPLPLFAYAAAAVGNIDMNGSSLVADSFSSADANLSTGGQYDSAKTSTNGNVASAQGFVDISNHSVNGSLYLGPTAFYSGFSNAFSGTIHTNFPMRFPDVVLPQTTWLPAPTINSTNDFTSSGDYMVGNPVCIVVEAGVTVTLNVTNSNFVPVILIHGGTTNSGTAYIYLNGPTSALLVGNTATDASNLAKNLCYFGLPRVTNIALSNIATRNFVGVIYAPSAGVTLSGSGKIIGSCITGTIIQNSHVSFHFDEDLLNNGPFR